MMSDSAKLTKQGTRAPVVKTARAKNLRGKLQAATNMSHETMRKANVVVEAAEADPEKFGALVAKMNATGNVSGTYRELLRLQRGIDRFTVDIERLGATLESVERRLYRLLHIRPERLSTNAAAFIQERVDAIQKLLPTK